MCKGSDTSVWHSNWLAGMLLMYYFSAMNDEFELINYIQKLPAAQVTGVFREFIGSQATEQKMVNLKKYFGIGNDCCYLPGPNGHWLAFSTDVFTDGFHFRSDMASPEDIAAKAMRASLSDLAPAGARPLGVMVGLGLPQGAGAAWLKRLMDQVSTECLMQGAQLLGGDSVQAQSFFLNITVVGEVRSRTLVSRAVAEVGDGIFVTGPLGDSSAGLEIVLQKRAEIDKESCRTQNSSAQGALELRTFALHTSASRNSASGTTEEAATLLDQLVRKHYCPESRWRQGMWLLNSGYSICMMDISDGLVGDLRHILQSSKKSAQIDLRKIPFSPILREHCQENEAQMLRHALTGGEDFELLLTIPADKIREAQTQYQKEFGQVLHHIGEVTALKVNTPVEYLPADTAKRLRIETWKSYSAKFASA